MKEKPAPLVFLQLEYALDLPGRFVKTFLGLTFRMFQQVWSGIQKFAFLFLGDAPGLETTLREPVLQFSSMWLKNCKPVNFNEDLKRAAEECQNKNVLDFTPSYCDCLIPLAVLLP